MKWASGSLRQHPEYVSGKWSQQSFNVNQAWFPVSPRFSQLQRRILSSFHPLLRAYSFCSGRRAGVTEAQPWCPRELSGQGLCTIRSQWDKQQNPLSRDPGGRNARDRGTGMFRDFNLQGERSLLTPQPERKPSKGVTLLSSPQGLHLLRCPLLSSVPVPLPSHALECPCPHMHRSVHKHIQLP